MKKLLIIASLLISSVCYSQMYGYSKPKEYRPNDISTMTKLKGWSLSGSAGYINIPSPYLGNNVWGSVNLGYSKRNWNVTFWGGSNYWIEGKQPDLRLGVTTSYTFLKW